MSSSVEETKCWGGGSVPYLHLFLDAQVWLHCQVVASILQRQLHQVLVSYLLLSSVVEFAPREQKHVCKLRQFYSDYHDGLQVVFVVDLLQKPQ